MVEVEDPGERPGVPDAFQRLWTPHRMVYIGGENKPATSTARDCPFCVAPDRDDRASLIVHRGRQAYVILNLYPYSPGHLLVCPYRHVADLTELSDEELAEIGALSQRAMRVTRGVSGPDGFNLGINQGAVAGAGIAAHLHQHVVPRWSGDANFLPVVAQTKAVPQLLDQAWELLSRAWAGSEATGAADAGA
ncbi:MAG TPA: HIT domain-containing protein [Microlunatus sp.]|jgi:ATP adenylyltransferase|nr:HIT domain-containing protein [Microlunatus sp.]